MQGPTLIMSYARSINNTAFIKFSFLFSSPRFLSFFPASDVGGLPFRMRRRRVSPTTTAIISAFLPSLPLFPLPPPPRTYHVPSPAPPSSRTCLLNPAYSRPPTNTTALQQPPSTSALLAAAAVYHPPSLAAAAAGAALRSATVSAALSTPGTIPTKRMLQRRASYSSASDVPRRSLSSRRFRSTPVRPAAPISSSSSSDDEDDNVRVPRRRTSARSFPTTMRGAATRRRSASDSDVGRPIPAPESTASTASELESIAEDATLQLSDLDDTTFEGERKASVAAARRTLTAGPPPKHTPPSRSVSPAKSALRHEPSTRKARVSFSDEDSIVSFSAYARAPLVLAGSESPYAPLPVFARTGRGEVEGSHEVVLTLTPPTPRDEEPPPGGFPGGFPGGDEGEDSDSGESIYSDAYEAFPAPAPAPAPALDPAPAPVILNAPEVLLLPPPAPPPPPPPPDRSTQYPSPASSDTASIRSVSSFRRLTPRRPGVTMLRSLRVAAPAAPQSKLSKPSPPFRSRFADDSDDDDHDHDHGMPAAAKLQRKRTASVAGSAQAGFWRGVFGRRRHQQAEVRDDKSGEPETWGVTTVIAGGPDSEAVGTRKKRFTRLRRLLWPG